MGPQEAQSGGIPRPYEISREARERVENDFTYHAPKEDQANRYGLMRARAKELALWIVQYTPQSREQSLALTNLEQAVFWANAAIARNE